MAVINRLHGRRGRLTLILTAVVLAVVVFGFASNVRSQTGTTGAENPLELEMTLSSWASSPGDNVSIMLSLINRGATAAMPEVTIQMPDQVLLDVATLPSGSFYNFQSRTVSWQPYVEPWGGLSQIELWVSVSVAELNQPEQSIVATVNYNGLEWNQSTTMWIGVLPQALGPITQLWTLDDGRVIDAKDPVVVFASPGSHTVNLQISNPLGSAVASGQIEISPNPIALFSVQDSTSVVGAPIAFFNESGGAEPVTYNWNFGDGSISTDRNPTHHYETPGVYQVSLRVQNDYGSSENYSFVEIGNPPSLELAISDNGQAGQLLYGQALIDGATTSVSWDMGDGRKYQGPDVGHIFWLPGDYVVTVTATNEFGMTQVSQWIRVAAGTLHYYLPFIIRGGSSDLPLGTEAVQGESTETINVGLGPQPELLPIEFSPGTTIAEQLFIYINEARGLFNLRPLSYVHSLSVAAQGHTDDMAAYGYTGHTGSDGSSPAYRLQLAGYTGGYGGEATAWGMSNALDPVQFWLTSPGHRAIILNPAVTEVGVGYTVDYNAPNVWYWTAEFASLHLPVVNAAAPEPPSTADPQSELLLLGPPQSSEFILSNDAKLIFSWSWTAEINESQRFAIYLGASGRVFQVGVVRQNEESGQYQLSVKASDIAIVAGSYQWQVRLEDSVQGAIVAESPYWGVQFVEQNQVGAEDPPIEPDVTKEPDPSTQPG
jgi:uncharacterized protein YkwD/PKD repeat protein